MELRKYISRRLVQITIIFFVILTVLFLLFRLAPGDPVSRMVDPDMTPEDSQRLIVQLGLDKPLGVQYLINLKNFFTGHFGYSFHYGEPVVDIIWDRLPSFCPPWWVSSWEKSPPGTRAKKPTAS